MGGERETHIPPLLFPRGGLAIKGNFFTGKEGEFENALNSLPLSSLSTEIPPHLPSSFVGGGGIGGHRCWAKRQNSSRMCGW